MLALPVSTVSALARTWPRPSRSARPTAACAWASHVSSSQRPAKAAASGGATNAQGPSGPIRSLGQAPGLGQPVDTGMIKQVDGAQLVQGAQPPQWQAGSLRGDQRALERRAGGAEITQPVAPADELQRMTADIRSTALGG